MKRPLKVLVVEDSPADAELVLHELQRSGFEPTHQRVCEEAELSAALVAEPWDVVISDHAMPKFSGAGALACLQRHGLDIPFVLVSGRLGEEEAVAIMRAGAQDYIMKSSLVRLGAAVSRELHEAETRRGRLDAERRYRELIERIPAITYVASCDFPARLVYISPQVEKWTSFSAEELLADSTLWWTRIPAEDRGRVQAELRAATEDGRPFSCEYRIRGRNDETLWVRDEAQLASESPGEPLLRRGFLVNITEMRIAQEVALQSLTRDRVTGLDNLTSLEERLRQEIAAVRSTDERLALTRIVLPEFRTVRNSLGHHNADRILREIGQRIVRASHRALIVARVGEEEFAVCTRIRADSDPTAHLTELHSVANSPANVDGLSVGFDCVLGVAIYPLHGLDSGTLLRAAAVAVEHARDHGVFMASYRSDQDPFDPRTLTLLGALQDAVARREVGLYYQPTVDLASGRALGVEALARWRHPTLGDVPPDRFVPLAEHSGLIDRFTELILEIAIRQASDWRRAGLRLRVNVNLSAKNLQRTQLVDVISELLNRWSLPPDALVAEVTESALFRDPVRAREVVTALHDLGVKIAIDDFGIGYATFDALRRFPISTIKIDRTFVKNMMTAQIDDAIVHATVRLAHELGMQVTAEGVEDAETLARLESIGCDSAQGYFLGRPMPAEEISGWLTTSGRGLIGSSLLPEAGSESEPRRRAVGE